MIMDNLISNFQREEQDDFGYKNQNFQEVAEENMKKFTKMASHEPNTQWSQNQKDSQHIDKINQQNGNNRLYKKTLTSSSVETNQYVRGNLVFTNNGINSSNSSPPKQDELEQKLSYFSPLFSREATIKKQSKELNYEQEDSTNEKIYENGSSQESVSPNSNQAVVYKGETTQINNIKHFVYEKAESNQADVASNDNSQNENTNQKVFHKSRFSKNQVSDSLFKKKESQSEDKQEDEDENSKLSPKSLKEIQITSQSNIQQNQHKVQSNHDLQINLKQSGQTNIREQKDYTTPSQRRKSMLKPVDTTKFKDLIERKKEEFQSKEPKTPCTPFSPADKFKIAGTVARTLSRLQMNLVNKIESTEQLDREIDQMKQFRQNSSLFFENKSGDTGQHQQRKEQKNNTVNQAFNLVRMVETITELGERGHTEDLNGIIEILQKDPKKYIRSSDDPEHLLNKLNSKNQNLAYIACKNGHMNIVQFLVKSESNFEVKSKLGGEIKEYPLQVAARWNHKDIVEFLLNQRAVKISQEQIKCAHKQANTKELKTFISKYLKSKPFFLCC